MPAGRKRQVATLTDLKNLSDQVDGSIVQVTRHSAGVNGGGAWRLDESSTATIDDVLVANATGHGSGRWKRAISGAYVTPQMGGSPADGSKDDTTICQAILDAGYTLYFPDGKYKLANLALPAYTNIIAHSDAQIQGWPDNTATLLTRDGEENIQFYSIRGGKWISFAKFLENVHASEAIVDMHVSECEFTDNTDNIFDGYFIGLWIHDCKFAGLDAPIIGGGQVFFARFHHNRVWTSAGAEANGPVFSWTNTSNVVVHNNWLENCYPQLVDNSNQQRNLTFRSNYFESQCLGSSPADAVIELSGDGSTLLLDDNYFTGNNPSLCDALAEVTAKVQVQVRGGYFIPDSPQTIVKASGTNDKHILIDRPYLDQQTTPTSGSTYRDSIFLDTTVGESLTAVNAPGQSAGGGPGGVDVRTFVRASSQRFDGATDMANPEHRAFGWFGFFYHDTMTTDGAIVSRYESGGGKHSYALFLISSTDFIRWYTSADGSADSILASTVTGLASATWHAALGYCDPYNDKKGLIVNGTHNTAAYQQPYSTTTIPLEIGGWDAGGGFWDGRLSKLTYFEPPPDLLATDPWDGIYTYLHNSGNGRTLANIPIAKQQALGIKHWFPLDEASGDALNEKGAQIEWIENRGSELRGVSA